MDSVPLVKVLEDVGSPLRLHDNVAGGQVQAVTLVVEGGEHLWWNPGGAGMSLGLLEKDSCGLQDRDGGEA